jgi:hypothetical protein
LHSHITLFARRHAETCMQLDTRTASYLHALNQTTPVTCKAEPARSLACMWLSCQLHLPRVLAPSARSTTHIWCTQLTPPSCTRTIRALHHTHLVHAAAAGIPEFRRHVLCRLHSTRTGTVAVTSSWPDQWIPSSLGTLDIAQGGDAIARPRAPGSRTSVSAVACVRVIGRSKTAAAPTVHTLASLAVAVCVRAGPRQSSCTATLTGTP